MTDLYAVEAYQEAPEACITDINAPTWPTTVGVQSVVMQTNGSARLTWNAAAHALNPIYYVPFVQKITATGLFSAPNELPATKELTVDVFELKDLTPLQEGEQYHFGVRARSAVGIVETNTVSISGISQGVLTGSLASVAASLKTSLQLVSGGVTGQVAENDPLTGEVEC